MTYKILIGLASLFGLFRLFLTTDNFAKTILIGQIIAIGLTLPDDRTAATIGLLLFMLTLMLAIIYGLTKKNFKIRKRILIIVPTVLVFVMHFFQLQHYPGAGLLGLTMALPIITNIILTTTDIKNYKNELGFLTIITVDATVEFLRRLEWIIN